MSIIKTIEHQCREFAEYIDNNKRTEYDKILLNKYDSHFLYNLLAIPKLVKNFNYPVFSELKAHIITIYYDRSFQFNPFINTAFYNLYIYNHGLPFYRDVTFYKNKLTRGDYDYKKDILPLIDDELGVVYYLKIQDGNPFITNDQDCNMVFTRYYFYKYFVENKNKELKLVNFISGELINEITLVNYEIINFDDYVNRESRNDYYSLDEDDDYRRYT